MSFKKKAIVMGLTIGMTFAFAIISLISIFAVSSLSLGKTNLTVTYKSTFFEGNISFYYKNATDPSYILVDKEISLASSGKLLSETITTSTIEDDLIVLSEENPYFILCWVIYNTSAETRCSATLSYTDTNETNTGINVTYAYSTPSASNLSDSKYLTPDFIADTSVSINGFGVNATTVSAGGKCFRFVKIALKDRYTSAVYDGEFTWTITTA